MKKILLTTVFVLPLLLQAQKNSKKMSVYIQGGYSGSNFLNAKAQNLLSSKMESHDHKCIIFNAGIQWNISDKWRIGPALTYDHFGTKHRSLEYSNVSYMLRADRIWKHSDNFSIYSGTAAGITKVRKFEDEIEKFRKTKIGYQIYVVGINYKVFKNFKLEANAGYGVSGLFNAGARFNF